MVIQSALCFIIHNPKNVFVFETLDSLEHPDIFDIFLSAQFVANIHAFCLFLGVYIQLSEITQLYNDASVVWIIAI